MLCCLRQTFIEAENGYYYFIHWNRLPLFLPGTGALVPLFFFLIATVFPRQTVAGRKMILHKAMFASLSQLSLYEMCDLHTKQTHKHVETISFQIGLGVDFRFPPLWADAEDTNNKQTNILYPVCRLFSFAPDSRNGARLLHYNSAAAPSNDCCSSLFHVLLVPVPSKCPRARVDMTLKP